jgi:hypothetical protein
MSCCCSLSLTREDAQKTICLVSTEFTHPIVHYPVSQTEKRVTLIRRIGADDSLLRPSLIIFRKTFDDEILIQEFLSEKVEIS